MNHKTIYPFTMDEQNTILNEKGNSYITKDNIKYVIPQFIKNLINYNSFIRSLILTYLYKVSSANQAKLSYEGVQIFFNNINITTKDQLRNLDNIFQGEFNKFEFKDATYLRLIFCVNATCGSTVEVVWGGVGAEPGEIGSEVPVPNIAGIEIFDAPTLLVGDKIEFANGTKVTISKTLREIAADYVNLIVDAFRADDPTILPEGFHIRPSGIEAIRDYACEGSPALGYLTIDLDTATGPIPTGLVSAVKV